ncbi:MAG: Fur family transcriptional regulator [Candidatus Tyrphobacter sp.]
MNPAHRPHLPKNYALVYEIIRKAGRGVHFTMNELFAHAKRRQPRIGFSTVYRGVARLRDGGLVDEIELPGSDSAVYELRATPHAHFRCERCGRVADVEYALSSRTIAAIAAQTGATISSSGVTLSGTCNSCR